MSKEALLIVMTQMLADRGFIFFSSSHTTDHVGSSFLDQGSNSSSPAVEWWSPNHWTARELLSLHLKTAFIAA